MVQSWNLNTCLRGNEVAVKYGERGEAPIWYPAREGIRFQKEIEGMAGRERFEKGRIPSPKRLK